MKCTKKTTFFLAVAALLLLGAASGASGSFHGTGVPVLVEAEPPVCKTDYDCRYFPGTQCNTATHLCFVPSSASACACAPDGDPCTDDGGTVAESGFCHCPRTRLTTSECTNPIITVKPITPGVYVEEIDPVTPKEEPIVPVVSPDPVSNVPDDEPEPTKDPVPTEEPKPVDSTPEDDTPVDETEPSPPVSDDHCSEGVVVLGDCKAKDFVHIQGGGDGCALIRSDAPTGNSLHGWILAITTLFLGGVRGILRSNRTSLPKAGLQIALFIAVFSLAGSALASPCGNGSLQGTEQCDDGNNADGDGCNSICLIEFCGDGIPQTALGETCDDKNAVDGDGCNACQTYDPWFCVGTPSICAIATPPTESPPVEAEGTPGPPKPVTGSELGFINELVQEYRPQQEFHINGYATQYAVPYVPPEYCGDGKPQAHLGEQCDDGNKAEDDGCNSLCQSTFRIQRSFLPRFDFLKLNAD